MRERIKAAVGFFISGSLVAAIAYFGFGVESPYAAALFATPAFVPWIIRIGFAEFEGFEYDRYCREKPATKRALEMASILTLSGVIAVPFGLAVYSAVPGLSEVVRFAVAFGLGLVTASLTGIIAMGRLNQTYLS